MQTSLKKPLFVTRFGLSDRTAIGAQTRYLLRNFPQYLHLYWHESVFDRKYDHSVRIENPLLGCLTPLKRDTVVSRYISHLPVRWWIRDIPAPSLVRYLNKIRNSISAVYFAPIEQRDAKRMRAMAEILGLPFVVHMWDFLDNGIAEPATNWLLSNANRVYCLNEEIAQDVAYVQSRTSILRFDRAQSSHFARPPAESSHSPRTIAIIGDIGSYREGVRTLIDAVSTLRAEGVNYMITYVGAEKMLRRTGMPQVPFLRATGFLNSPEARDAALLDCSIGFLPGPTADPGSDRRSKYSIPSRILDFAALGLAVVGTVHPDSATFSFCSRYGLAGHITKGTNDESLVHALRDLLDRNCWLSAQRTSIDAFGQLHGSTDINALLTAMQAVPTARPATATV